MSILNIPTAVGNALSSLSSHIGHKKGGHAGGTFDPLNSTTSSTSSTSSSSSTSASSGGQPSGSTQSLFGTLLDSVEQVAGIQMTASHTPNAAMPHISASSLNAGLTPASIAAAQAALKKT